MIELFVKMALGHFVGDFMAQPKWMAMQKADAGWNGAYVCTVHVILYTGILAMFTGIWDPGVLLAIATPHWLIDRWSIAKVHLSNLGGRTPDNLNQDDPFDAAFTALMYTVVDATMHLLFLYGTAIMVARAGLL